MPDYKRWDGRHLLEMAMWLRAGPNPPRRVTQIGGDLYVTTNDGPEVYAPGDAVQRDNQRGDESCQ